MSVTHTKVSAKSDPADTTLVRPSDWNAAHTIADGSITAAMLAVPPPYSVYVAPGGDIQAAIDAMPASGGIIQLGAGTYTITSLHSNTPDRAILIQGVGSDTAGADAPTVIQYTGSGSGSIITMPLTASNGFRDLEIKYTNTGFTGILVDLQTGSSVGADTSQFYMDNVILWGSHAAGQTATLLHVGQTIDLQFNRVDFNGGGYGVRGGRHVAVTGISVANPSIITAPAHGFTNGATVRFGGMTTTPQLGTGANTYVITVIDANTFSIPVNITNVAVGTGFVNSKITDTENANQVKFTNCQWRNQVVAGVTDPQQSWLFDTCLLEIMYNGDLWKMIHTPGNWASAVTFLNCWAGDQTTTTTASYIAWAGQGLNIIGCRWGGRQVAAITVVTFDDNNCDGYVIAGNMATALTHWIDFGTTTGHTRGIFQGNGSIGNAPGYSALSGTIPKGLGYFNGAAGTDPSQYDLTGAPTATVLRFDGDTLAQLYRTAAGIIRTDAALYTGDHVIAGQGAANGTQLYGVTGGLSGLLARASGTDQSLNLEAKGAGIVKVDGFNGTGGAQISKSGGKVGFFGTTPSTKAAITGNVTTGTLSELQGVVGALLTELAAKGLLTKSTT